MQIDINTTTYSIKQRILAFFMAFMIFSLTCPEIFEGLGVGLIVHAAEGNPTGLINYEATVKKSLYTTEMNENAGKTGSVYTYTGNYTNNNKVTLFDYITDNEITGNDANGNAQGYSYNNYWQKDAGYTDPFTRLNDAISQGEEVTYELHASGDNITIKFATTTFSSSAHVYVYLWQEDANGNKLAEKAWPGLEMNYDDTDNCYVCTFNRTVSSSTYYLNFNPNRLIFNNNSGLQTINIEQSMTTGNTYSFSEFNDSTIKYRYNRNYNGNEWDVTDSSKDCYLYVFGGDGQVIGNPGKKMTRVGSYIYTYEIDTDDLGTPDNFLLHNGSWTKKTADLPYTPIKTKAGYTYSVYKENSTDNYITCKELMHNVSLVSDSAPAQSIYTTTYSSNYTIPLYFGGFWKDNGSGGYTSTNKPGTDSTHGPYNNFYWQANMGLKPYDTDERGTASMQGLVYGKLSGTVGENYTGNLLDTSATTDENTNVVSGAVLPYFDTGSSLVSAHLMRYYDKDTDDKHDITFPFYETYKKHGNSETEYEKYYQFDSREANLKFVFDNMANENDHKGYFSETTGAANSDIFRGTSVAGDRSNVGFFPFNSTNGIGNDTSFNNHNLGFGQKIVMDFQLEPDGCVSPVSASTSNGVTTLTVLENSTTRIPTIFEFNGDDDLWVFIDGNLVLDMGGDHNRSTGKIDFEAKTATVTKASVFGATSNSLTGTDYDNLGAKVENNKVLNNIHTLLGPGSYTTGTDGKIKYTKKTHTMTIFYMERGMMDSNLMIRYNYTPINNFSKMKIAEVTKFDGVNAGLLDLTKIAAEDDVFKYTVQNTGTNVNDIADSGAKFPTKTEVTRQVTVGGTTYKTQMTPNGTADPTAAPKYVPSNRYVKDTGYWWVDKTVSPSGKMVGLTTDNGELWLKYGTDTAVYENDDGLESSAEFEKQFSRDSDMTVTQGQYIYRLARSGSAIPILFNTSNQIKAQEWDGQTHSPETTARPERAVADYYTTQYRLIDRNDNILFNEDSATYSAVGEGKRNSSFKFNNAPGLPVNLEPMLTEYVENTVRTGTLTITNKIINGTPNEEFEYTIQLNNVFGVPGDPVSNYENLSAVKSSVATTSSGAKKTTSTSADPAGVMTNVSDNKATFKLKDGQQVVIRGIPLGTSYSVTQEGKEGVTTTVQVNSGEVRSAYNGSGAPDKDIENQLVAFVNNRSVEITGEKTNGKSGTDKKGLSGAELDLYIRENENPPTYSFNTRQTVPTKTIENKIPSGNGINIPDDETVSTEIKRYDKTYTYGSDNPPTASDSDWILPRNDSDYIYFRDYNDANGTTAYLGTEDKTSFGSTGNVAWRQSFFAAKSDGTHHQEQEIGFQDEDANDNKHAWIAAQFTKNNGQDFVEYSVWERFVDKYNSTNTVVWKIQPPDGYTEVRFCLYYGDKCIRTTERFNFELGKIYHKTNWGSSYSSDNGGSYWDVPVTVETANNGYWAPTVNAQNTVNDQRMTGDSPIDYTATMAQARKYEPTEQKIVFHCNSAKVWHNIHIQFFDETGALVNGQPFPGYMMEPYAYAGNDYRMSDGYLTYELTIPSNAKSFQINNGIASGDYAFKTEKKALYNAESNGKATAKNYGNYFCLEAYNTSNSETGQDNPKYTEGANASLYKLQDWSNNGDPQQTADYTTKEVESDYDYIYFEKPNNSWKDHVYAYFYGGGNLRADNWQRACYSAWPGVAAAGTEYKDNGTQYYSSTYNYPIADDGTTDGEEYNGTTLAANKLSPETTFKNSNGNTVYKFRIPKGDRTNYSKVIFNDGLSSQGGKYETGVIEYFPGYLYTSDGVGHEHSDGSPTESYATRSGNDDYIYVKMKADTAQIWDDPHITFYDNYGRQILQSGYGYVMDYAGTNGGYQYYRVPIPADSVGATRFKINNGISRPRETDFYDILRKSTVTEPNTANDYTTGKLVYTLGYDDNDSTTTVQRIVPSFTENVQTTFETINDTQDSKIDYETRGDKLKILDDAPWIASANSTDGIGTFKVKFYKSDGTLITTKTGETAKGAGTYTLIQSKEDADHHRWYTIDIPKDAVKFTLTSPKGTTAPYDIYTKVDNVDANGLTGNRTADGMYYHTKSDGTLALIDSTVQATGNTVEANDETYSKRGDNLYLVTSEENLSDIKVVFYGADGTAFQDDAHAITAKYIADKDSDQWYKVSIPNNATSFKVIAKNGANNITLKQADIYELKSKLSRYKENYTLGDMQYRITATDDSKPELLYPVFTKNDEYTIDVGGNTISSNMAVPQVDESAVSGYSGVGVAPKDTTSSEPDNVLLYNTSPAVTSGGYTQAVDSNNIVKKWTTGAADNNIYYNNANTDWSSVYVCFFNDTGAGDYNPTIGGTWSETPMSLSSDLWQVEVPAGVASASNPYVMFHNNYGSQTVKVYLNSSNNKGKGYVFSGNAATDSNLYLYSNNNWSGDNGKIWASFDSGSTWIEGDDARGDVGGNGSRKWTISGSPTNVRFKQQDGYQSDSSSDFSLSSYNNGKGVVLQVTGTGSVSFKQYKTSTTNYSVNSYANPNASGVTNYTATYQPEDRYGYIDSINSVYGYVNDDKNNFIYIDTTGSNITDPHVMFYDDVSAGGTQICGYQGSTKVNIKVDFVDTNLYRVRLPKNAKSFKIGSGSNILTLGSSYYNLDENLSVGTTDVMTVPNFRHAGSTFSVDSSKVITLKSVREGYTVGKDAAMADPLNPKTDSDFVYFTDTNNNFGESGTANAVYAYFFGDVDGAYTTWPGVKAMTPNTGYADTTYTDNDDKTVYAFRIPKGSEGKYSKVIFTDGAATNPKVTQAQDLTGGANYVLNTTSSGRNGAFATAAYPVTAPEANQKASLPTIDYSTNEGKTIYIINNGTPYAVGSTGPTDRTPLDDMHVVFYDESGQAINHTAGYKPDKITSEKYGGTNGSDVYKITAPDNAVSFQITNGTGKGSSGGKERHSEIKALTDKGLYRFIDASEVTNKGNTSSYVSGEWSDDLSSNTYLLGLANKLEDGDEEIPTSTKKETHIATIVTGSDGKQDYIKWLKPDPTTGSGVDTKYLQATDTAASPPVNKVGNKTSTSKTIKLAASGDYFWKESKAPTGYTQKTEETNVPSGASTATVGNDDIVGDLKLVKNLAEGMPSSLDSQDFVYTVTLTASAGTFVLDESTIKINGTALSVKKFAGTVTNGVDNLTTQSYTTTSQSVSADGATATFTVNVRKAAYVVVGNLPYGTQYSVSEAMPDSTWKRVYPSGTDPITGKITSADTYTASFTNAKTAPLTISKTVTLVNVPQEEQEALWATEFEFTVKLSNTDLNLSDYALSYSYSPNSGVTAITPEANTKPTTFTVKLKKGQSAMINGIPVGTQYQVSETAGGTGTGWTTNYTLTDGSTTTADNTTGRDAQASKIADSGSTAAFTNKYETPTTKTLRLKKEVEGKLPASLGVNPKFIFTVELKVPTGTFEEYTEMNRKIVDKDNNDVSGTSATITSSTDTITLDNVYLRDGDMLVVEGLPDNTTYKVTEQKDENQKYRYSSDGTTYSEGTFTSANKPVDVSNPASDYTAVDNNIAKFINKYPVGSLQLIKNLANGTPVNDTTKAQEFTYNVTLNRGNSSTVDLRDYILKDASNKLLVNGTALNSVTVGTYDEGQIKLVVQVKATTTGNDAQDGSVTIPNIPKDTTYEVTETAPSGWKKIGSEVYIDKDSDSSATPTISANGETDTVTVTNAQIAELVLHEVVLNGTSTHSNDKFTFTVDFDAPEGVIFTDSYFTFKDKDGNVLTGENTPTVSLSTIVNGTNVGVNRHATITAKISHGKQVVIGNVPYGTKYTVTQDENPTPAPPANSEWKQIATYYDEPVTHTTSTGAGTETPRTINAPTQHFTAENAITGGLAISKTTSGSDLPSNTEFTITLTMNDVPPGIAIGNDWITSKGTHSTTEVSGTGNRTRTVKITGADTVTVFGIPQDTKVTLTEETMPNANWQQTSASNNEDITISDGIIGDGKASDGTAASNDKPASFTNSYTPSNVTLFKQDSKTHAGIPSADFYLLKLKDGLDTEDADVQKAFKNGKIELDSTDNKLKLKVDDTFKDYAEVVDIHNNNTDVLKTQTYPNETAGDGDDDNIGGTITVTERNSATIINFSVGDRYFFFEKSENGTTIFNGTTPLSYKKDNTLSANKIITINDYQIDYTVTYSNEPIPPGKDVEIEKRDKTDNEKKLGGAIFNLWFEETIIPSTYTVNAPQIAPPSKNTTKITSAPNVPEPSTEKYTTPPVDKYTYTNPEVSKASEKEWILPRTDNDYIYFRDYNIGSDKYYGDTGAFNSGDDNTRWIDTSLGKNPHGQQQELIYDTSLWIKAKFTATGKPDREYAVWERFIDKYNNKDTVVWKIQPPDGYTNVEFILCQGNNHLRNTQSFKYVLGNIYTKKNKGIYDGGQYGYPVQGEHWSTNWRNEASGNPDKRMTYSTDSVNTGNYVFNHPSSTTSGRTAPVQAERYTPTEQKIVFHCNSKNVWHNIHIEFFDENNQPVGQSFPGYLMEPYAYAGSDYRINGYLTYELTIPAEASYFRVNNGIDNSSTPGDFNEGSQSAYAFRSEIKKLYTADEKNGRKNYGNYFKIDDRDRDVNSSKNVRLVDWTSYPTGNGKDSWNETYSTINVDSDYDFVYFEKPDNWNDHVYAYFYGGGDLRKDNWQRATYSVWPGVAPVATEYEKDSEEHHSDTYDYSYTGTMYGTYESGGGDTKDSALNPESTFIGKNGKTVYKFRIPKGDRTNYSKVIFNDGLYSQKASGKGTHETGVIDYKAGYIYDKSGNGTKHYENSPTYTYEKRGNGDDYIYIKVTSTDLTTWDDMHIRFYDSNDNQILQQGVGYVMEYSGTSGSDTYFRMPIPTNAAKFSINNGMEKNDAHSKEITAKYKIFRLDTVGDDTSRDYTKDRMVYALDSSNNKLNLVSPTFPKDTNNSIEGNDVEVSQDSHVDYNVRGQSRTPSNKDTLNIRNTDGWKIKDGSAKVKFYDENGNLIKHSEGKTPDGDGTYTLIKTDVETTAPTGYGANDKKSWYTIEIPENAKTFTVTYINSESSAFVTTPSYEIYPYGAADSTDDNHTQNGNMYYETTSDNPKLQLMTGTYSQIYTYTEPTYTKRGDNLYLVCADKNAWQNMKVTFYHNGTAITGAENVDVQYLNYVEYEPLNPVAGVSTSDENAVGHWFRVPIPEGTRNSQNEILGPTSFTVTGTDAYSNTNTSSGEIFRKIDTPTRYANDYTLGDMQYRLPDAGDRSTLVYPIFTEQEAQSVEVGGQTIYADDGVARADESQISDFAKSDVATFPKPDSSFPNDAVLYQTDAATVKYEWAVPSSYIYFDNSKIKWDNIYVYCWGGSYNSGGDTARVADNRKMEKITGTDVYKFDLSTLSTITDISNFTNVLFFNGLDSSDNMIVQTVNATLTAGTKYIPDIYDSYMYVQGNGHNSENGTIQAIFPDTTNNETSDGAEWDGDATNHGRKWEKNRLKGPRAAFRVHRDNTEFGTTYVNVSLGQVWKLTSNNSVQFVGFMDSNGNITNRTTDNDKVPLTTDSPYTGTGAVNGTASATYQPEDRYGYITDVTGTDDKNNFIYIDTALSKPTIHFYSDNDGSGNIEGATSDISLKYTKVNGTTVAEQTSPYKIRLPKNAKSFKVTSVGKSVTQNLYEDGFHHAGTTFTVAVDSSDSNKLKVESKTKRDGYTENRSTAFTEPLNPKSDMDYIFFTDTGNTFANSNTVYAYYYGDADGEYSYKVAEDNYKTLIKATNTDELTNYTDNNGTDKVYMFRVPQGKDGKYKKVIFTDGVNDNTRKITKAVDLEPGKNYILGAQMQTTDATPQAIKYGSFSSNVYDVTVENKTEYETVSYGNSGKSLYIINNGTQNLGGDGTGRFKLDEMHIQFYYADGTTPVGTGGAGYIPDLLTTYVDEDADEDDNPKPAKYNGHDVYRIQIPNGASYFQINNGINKGGSSKVNERYSVVEPIIPNGLYQFVESSDTSKITKDAQPENTADRYKPKYELKLVNNLDGEDIIPIKTDIIKLATVESNDADDNKGKIKWITWLKPEPKDPMPEGKKYDINDPATYEPNTVDSEYLNHTTADLKPNMVDNVHVVKTGKYYWVEEEPPTGYKINKERLVFEYKDDGKVYYYDENNNLVEVDDTHPMFIGNEPNDEEEPDGKQVKLLKVAKDATHSTDVGQSLGENYGFLLFSVAADGTATLVDNIAKSADGQYYVSTSAPSTKYNTASTWSGFTADSVANAVHEYATVKPLLTNENGEILVKNLPDGDYYFEEVGAPDGSLYSENFIHGWIKDKDENYVYDDRIPNHVETNYEEYSSQVHNRVKFTITEDYLTEPLELVCANEMVPAYIRLFEHINEWRPNEWGSPTFIFKVKQTHTYNDKGNDPTNAVYTPIDDGKEYIIALTVDDKGRMTKDTFLRDENEISPYDGWYFESSAKNYHTIGSGVPQAEVEYNEDDNKYANERLFGLNSDGMLEVEPGKYTISRINPSRYEFVANFYEYFTSTNAQWVDSTYDSSTQEYKRAISKYRSWYNASNEENEKRDGIKQYEDGNYNETITELQVQPYRVADIHYYDKVAYYDKFSQVETKINSFHRYTNENDNRQNTVKGIRVELRGKVQIPASGNSEISVNTVNDEAFAWYSSDNCQFNAYFINADGSERAMTADEKAKLVISYTASGDDDKFAKSDTGFSFDDDNKKIIIKNPSDYAKHVYTLKATYDGKFTSNFDIVFGSTSS